MKDFMYRKVLFPCKWLILIMVIICQAGTVMARVEEFSPMEMTKAAGFMDVFLSRLGQDQDFHHDIQEKKDVDDFLQELRDIRKALQFQQSSLEDLHSFFSDNRMDERTLEESSLKIHKVTVYIGDRFSSLCKERFNGRKTRGYRPEIERIIKHLHMAGGRNSDPLFFERIKKNIEDNRSIVEFRFEINCLTGQLASLDQAIDRFIRIMENL